MLTHHEMVSKALKRKNPQSAHGVVTDKNLSQEPSFLLENCNFLVLSMSCRGFDGSCQNQELDGLENWCSFYN